MKELLKYFIRFLWTRAPLDAFAVVVWMEPHLTPKDKYDLGVYLKASSKLKR